MIHRQWRGKLVYITRVLDIVRAHNRSALDFLKENGELDFYEGDKVIAWLGYDLEEVANG